jgi:dTMP kinase
MPAKRDPVRAEECWGASVLSNFIVLEGLDGSGTTTQLRLLEHKLSALGIPCFCTGEPTDGPIGQVIREILQLRHRAHPNTVALLFAADRSEHLWQQPGGIVPRLRRGELVICDRYLFSSLAYQSLECDYEFVLSLNRSFPLPERVFFLDTPAALSQQRLEQRSGRMQELFDRPEIQRDILAGYERAFACCTQTGMAVHRLDGRQEPRRIFENLWTILQTVPMLKP